MLSSTTAKLPMPPISYTDEADMATSQGGKRSHRDDPVHDIPKRPRVNAPEKNTLVYDDYTVGWICALPIEMTAAEAMLDKIHGPLQSKPHDINSYSFGNIADHNVVIACLPIGHYGTNNAAIVATNMCRTFPSIEKRLLVGIGGGVPESADIRLGDIVVSDQVVQYDFGKAMPNGKFHRTSVPTRPPQSLTTALAKLQARHNREGSKVPLILAETFKRYPLMVGYDHPGIPDRLLCSTCNHIKLQDTCDDCSMSELLHRQPREDNNPKVHYGKIASGNQVIKDGVSRAKISSELGALCFEMEAAGCMDNFPCLVIRGICDYSDSHKNNKWQKYAAAVAAAYSKELLLGIPTCESGKPHSGHGSPCQEISTQDRWELILDSLTFHQIESRYDTIKAAHAKTCEWLLSHDDYIAWLDSTKFREHHGFLWISGKPGAGKSTLMKFVYSRTYVSAKTAENSGVVSFFFNARGVELEKTTVGMYRSLLFQILIKFPELQQELKQMTLSYDENNQIFWSIEKLQMLFLNLVSNLDQRCLTCFIDALDECNEVEVRAMVEYFEKISKLAAENGAKFYVCFSSRHYPHIQIENGIRLTLENQPGHSQDLEKYIRSKLKTGSKKATKEISLEVLEKSSGVFMWVVLVIDILNKEFNKGRIFAVKKRLKELPRKLSDLFRDILQRDNENLDDLLLCIQWILYAKRPLTCEEFYFALVSGLDPSLENFAEWDNGIVTAEHMRLYLLSSSKGLAELTKSKRRPTVQFIHESVRDFLIKDNGIRDLWPEYSDNFEGLSHDRLKRCCLANCKIDLPNILPTSFSEMPTGEIKELREKVYKMFPFLEYATTYVLHHADAAENAISQEAFITNEFPLSIWAHRRNLFAKFKTQHYTNHVTLVYIFADQGLLALTRIALRHGKSSEFNNEQFRHRILATSRVDPDSRDNTGRTPLSWAASIGSIEPIKLLLATGRVDPDSRDNTGRTPLSWAAGVGNIEPIKLLLATGRVDPDSRDNTGRTPLSWAAGVGNIEPIKLLLATGRVDPDSKECYRLDNTALCNFSWS